jgi:hypothetical protein
LKINSLSKYVNCAKVLSDTKEPLNLKKFITSHVSSPSANIAEEVEPKPLIFKTSNKKVKNLILVPDVSILSKLPSSTTNREKVNMFKHTVRKSAGDVSASIKKIKISKTYITSLGLRTNFDLSSVYQKNLAEKRAQDTS